MTPPEVLAVFDVSIRGTELPPTLEAAHAQICEFQRALSSMDTGGTWLNDDEAARLHKWFTYTQGMNLLPIDYDILKKAEY